MTKKRQQRLKRRTKYITKQKLTRTAQTGDKVTVATAEERGSEEIGMLIEKEEKELCVDKGYTDKNINKEAKAINEGKDCVVQIHQENYRNKPMSASKIKTEMRSQVDRVFGHVRQSMNGLFVRCRTCKATQQ